jgi:SAM-dependent methyltransferase
MLGFSKIIAKKIPIKDMLFLGPGSGREVQQIVRSYPDCQLSFLETSERFQAMLRERFPISQIITPKFNCEIELDDKTQDLVCAFSVLHHIAKVSKVISEVSRVTRPGGFFLVREPCSSMGDWRFPRSATPNERGISRNLMIKFAEKAGFVSEEKPIPILLEPINKLQKKTIGFRSIPFPALFWIDKALSKLVSWNDHYWRDSWIKKIGPSSYFYLFRKQVNC